MAERSKELARASAVLMAVVLCAEVAAFRPVLRGSFFLDDLVRFYDLANYGFVKLLISPHAGHLLLTSNGLYALFRGLFGLEAWPWFAMALLLHAVNTLLLFDLVRRLDCDRWTAAVMAALWGLCPVQGGALRWIAVFGQMLLATFALLVMRDMVAVARRNLPVGDATAWRWWLLAVLAATSFASGLGVAMAWFVVAAVILHGVPDRRRVLSILGTLAFAVPLLYASQLALYQRLYSVMPFAQPALQLHAEPRALAGRALEIAWFTVDFVSYGIDVLLFGSPAMRLRSAHAEQNPQGWLIAPALLVVVLAVSTVRRASGRRRREALACLILALSAYGLLAAGGVSSGRLDAFRAVGVGVGEAIFNQATEPRYHYVPTMFLTAALAVVLGAGLEGGMRGRRVARTLLVALPVCLALRAPWDHAFVSHMIRISPYSGAVRRLEAVLARPGSGPRQIANEPIGGSLIGIKNEALPGLAALFVILHPDGDPGTTLRFAEADPVLRGVLQAQAGTPISRLIVAPAQLD